MCAPVAQLDRASDYESEGRTFESFRARQFLRISYDSDGDEAEFKALLVKVKTTRKIAAILLQPDTFEPH
jgi:hypothetical protein